MTWQKKRKKQGKNRYYSLAKKLRRKNKTTEEFEIMLNGLNLEDVIGLKLELASKTVSGKLFGFPIWGSMPSIVKNAVLNYAMSAARTQGEAANFLGINISDLNKLLKKYNIEEKGDEQASTRQ